MSKFRNIFDEIMNSITLDVAIEDYYFYGYTTICKAGNVVESSYEA